MSTTVDKTTIEELTARTRLPVGTPTVSVVVPTLNEERNLPIVFGLLPEGLHEVIVVDGRSTDDTVAVARRLRPDTKVVLETRKGKGAALQAGFAAATGDIIVMLDADGSADPCEIVDYVEALTSGADFAKGSRFLPGAGSSDITPLRRFGNSVLCFVTNRMWGSDYTDLCYGYNAFWAHCLPVMDVDCDGFEVETLINIRIAEAGLDVSEVPSFEFDRIHGESNLNAFRDGLRILRTMTTERVARARARRAERANARRAHARPDAGRPDEEIVIDLRAATSRAA
jgi:glycosyltransferase involved in cell wall biosynthesis